MAPPAVRRWSVSELVPVQPTEIRSGKLLEIARRALDEADGLPDIAALVDRAEVVRVAARKAKLSLDAQNDWAEFKLDAERKAGDSLRQMEKQKPGQYQRSHDVTVAPKLSDIGVTKMQAHRWQRLATLPDEAVETYKAEMRAKGGEITTAGALDLVRQSEVDARRAEHAAQERTTLNPVPSVEKAEAALWLSGQAACDLLLTDPPYSTDVDDIEAFAATWLPTALAKVKPTGRAYICIGAYPNEMRAYLNIAPPAGLILAQVLVWTYRNTMGPSPTLDYKQNWQAILYYRGIDAPRLDCPDLLEQLSVQDVNAADGAYARWHAWQKPIKLASRLIRHATQPGDLILDPFCGTGTFLISAAQLGRQAAGCDPDPDMLAIAKERGCQLAG
jgi:DNA methylase